MDRTYSADGTTIAFDRSGQGPALILVMGAFCDRSSTTSLASALASRFTVYEYDRRGRGDSGDTAPYSTRREVEDLSAIVDAAGGSAYAFGHSSGAAVALEAAASGVALLGVAAYEPPYTPGPSSQFADRLEALASSGREGDAAEAFIALTGTPPQVLEQMKTAPYWAHMTSFAGTLAYDVRLCNGGAVPVDRLARITVPVLALAGGESAPWAREVADAIADAVPDGERRVLDGQGHGVADEVLVPVLEERFLGRIL